MNKQEVYATSVFNTCMARYADHARALELRAQGKTYSEIKSLLTVGKGTLSAWLRDYPLSPEVLRKVQAESPQRIEAFRNTMHKKRQARRDAVFEKVSKDLSHQSKETLLALGFYLYWAEGGKTDPYTVMMANTDYTMLRCFLDWLVMLGWERTKVRVRVQLYADMDADKELTYWQTALGLPKACFRKPYIKKTNRSAITYKGGFCHGTCNIYVYNRDLAERVLMGVRYLRSRYDTGN